MSQVVLRLVQCDTCETERTAPFPTRDFNELRIYLHQQGWHNRKTRDICPTCWKNGTR